MKLVLPGCCCLAIGGFILLSACNGVSKQSQQASKGKDSVSASNIDTIGPKIQFFTKRIAANPRDADSYWRRGILEAALKQYEPAKQDYDKAIKIDSNKADYYYMLADLDFITGHTRDCKDVFEKCISVDPKNTDALIRLGELYFYVKKYPEAIEYLDKALKINPHLARPYFEKGMIFLEKKDTAKAISSMQTAVEQDTKYFDAYIELGLVFTRKGKSIAIDYFNDAINTRPGNVEAYYDKAMFYQQGQDYDDAIKTYRELLQVDSTYKYALYNMGVIYYIYKQDYSQAVQYFSKAINSDNAYALAYYGRGNSYEQLDRYEDALRDFSAAKQYDPGFTEAADAIRDVRTKMHK